VIPASSLEPLPFQSAHFLRKWIARRRAAPGTLDVLPDVYSPQLGNRRDILVYLPSSYAKSDRRFPVIYMHDGQNLFDPTTSFAGEWGVDVALAKAPRRGRRAIIVGIPNTGTDRIREYTPFVDDHVGGGLGDAYLDFMLETVKPMVDAKYRTLPEPEHTGIAGSSLGGLISLYGFFRDPPRFGFAGVLSPALWIGGGEIFRIVEAAPYVRGRIHLDIGTREGARALHDARRMRELLIGKGYRLGKDLSWIEERGGMHNEKAWGRRFRKALPFLLAGPER
jgi:predicted alpha/beta superfamily hydrolase